MNENNPVSSLRDSLRVIARKLGVLDEYGQKCCGVTAAQCHVLLEIGKNRELSLNELSEKLGIDKSGSSRVVEQLVSMGYLLRETNVNDRRFVKIKLTEEGMSRYLATENGMNVLIGDFYENIPVDKREQFIESIELLKNLLCGQKNC